MNNVTFKQFLAEYSFKKVLPKDITKIYPIHFSDEETELLNQIDGGWHAEPHKCGCDQLVSKFYKERTYKLGSPKLPFVIKARRFRDRIRLTFDVYPSNDLLDDPNYHTEKRESYDIKFDNNTQLKRLICQTIKKIVD